MQAIITRHLNPTNSRGPRIKATCAAGSITIDYPHELTHDEPHKFAAAMLCAKLAKAGAGKHWQAPMVCGQLPSGDWAHVFVGDAPRTSPCPTAPALTVNQTPWHGIGQVMTSDPND